MISSILGRNTLTATVRPSWVTALCTTASDALPRGTGSIERKSFSTDDPRSLSMASRTCS